ncbi:MAG: phosphoribosylaminoimidazolesuccinocarboxamide synthase, partial [Synechococcaceae cyanobacterium]|nr:phosphoribosylaminoimidazolesuccinocarboxamide synthase [Synechococcaceae cyanobacterium]
MTPLKIGPLLHEGKAKRVHATDRPGVVAVEYKDDATAFNAQKKASLSGKGVLNCHISALLFEQLEAGGVPTHYLGVTEPGWMIARAVRVIPLEVVVRNRAAGSLCRQLPIAAGTALQPPLLDFYYKDDALGDPLLSEARLQRLELLDADQLEQVRGLALRVNSLLRELLGRVALDLVDFKIELGHSGEGTLLLADEISPDTCRLWDTGRQDVHDRILDKDRFRQDLGGVVEAYGE